MAQASLQSNCEFIQKLKFAFLLFQLCVCVFSVFSKPLTKLLILISLCVCILDLYTVVSVVGLTVL